MAATSLVQTVSVLARLIGSSGRRKFQHSGFSISSTARLSASTAPLIRDQIIAHTALTNDHLTPEIRLHLITSKCALYRAKAEECPFVDPYWAFYWPGGQALSRFILDNPDEVRGKRVLDFGSGCGATSIVTLMSGALRVTSNDTDPTAAVAVKLNVDLNGHLISSTRHRFKTDTRDLVGSGIIESDWDVIAVGDMFYDVDSVDRLSEWLTSLKRKGRGRSDRRILIGDPGRLALEKHDFKRELQVVGEYRLPLDCVEQNRGMSVGYVWTFS